MKKVSKAIKSPKENKKDYSMTKDILYTIALAPIVYILVVITLLA